jgi:hypothetical protein
MATALEENWHIQMAYAKLHLLCTTSANYSQIYLAETKGVPSKIALRHFDRNSCQNCSTWNIGCSTPVQADKSEQFLSLHPGRMTGLAISIA